MRGAVRRDVVGDLMGASADVEDEVANVEGWLEACSSLLLAIVELVFDFSSADGARWPRSVCSTIC
jgi:hypothetical protein